MTQRAVPLYPRIELLLNQANNPDLSINIMLQKNLLTHRVNFIILLLLLLLTSCAIRVPKKAMLEKTTTESRQTEPAVFPPAPEYHLGFGDVIEVKFFNNEKFNEILTIRPDGRISMQKVGDILVAGMTPMELSKLITENYAKIIINPEVTVIVRNFSGHQVYVLGEVKTPGAYPIQKNLTILQSLALAGGQKETATLKSILLIRRSHDGAVDIRRIDLSKNSPDAIQKNDVSIQAFDIIYAPKTFIANINTFLDQAFSGVIPPLDIYLRAAWWSRW